MANLKKPLRMCVVCRSKLEKTSLLRLKCKDKKLIQYDGIGRSFYICYNCMEENFDKNAGKIEKALRKECKNKDEYIVQLKEILTNVRKCKSI